MPLDKQKNKKSRRRLRRVHCQSARAELIRAAEGYFWALGETIAPDNIGRMVAAHLERLKVHAEAKPQVSLSPAASTSTPVPPEKMTQVRGVGVGPSPSAPAPRQFSYPDGPLNVVPAAQAAQVAAAGIEQEGDARPTIVLHRPEIPPNTGTIARLCAAFQLPLVLIGPLGFDISEKAFRRAGLDYWEWVDLSYFEGWQRFVASLKDSHRRLVFVETFGSAPVGEFVFEPGDVLVFGSETTGLPSSVFEASCDRRSAVVRIPMPAVSVRSINLANAVAIVASHAVHRPLGAGGAGDGQSSKAPGAKK